MRMKRKRTPTEIDYQGKRGQRKDRRRAEWKRWSGKLKRQRELAAVGEE